MASVTCKRGTKAEIESTQIQDGQLLMETDQLNNNKIYLDLPNGTRVPVGGSGAWVGTKEEFELAVEEGKIADGTQVIITDDYESGITASMTLYSNAQSGLVATNVQSAIDELNSNLTKYAKFKDISVDTDSEGNAPIGSINGVIPLSCIPITVGVSMSSILCNGYGIYYAKTDAYNTKITVRVTYTDYQ